MIVGIIVQIISISCPSIIDRLENEFLIILKIIYIVIIVIEIIIIIEWSWKNAICSITGEFISGNDIWDQVIISILDCYLIIMLFCLKVCSEGGKFIIHSIEAEEEKDEKTIFLLVNEIQIIIIRKTIPINEIIDPIDENKFHFEKKSG